jgi:DNA-binding beta-propeller fold protein YncE
VLAVHGTAEGWYHVAIPADAQHPERRGFVSAKLVELVPGRTVATPDAGVPAAASRSTTPTAFVLDRAQRSVSAVDAISGETRATRFGTDPADRVGRESADLITVTPDGTTLAVIDGGAGDWSLSGGWRPRRKSSIALVGIGTFNVVARAEGVWGLPLHAFSRDGHRLAVVGAGVGRLADPERRSAEVVTLDLARGEVTGRLSLDSYLRPSDRWFDWFTNVAVSPDGEYLYLLDPGKASRNRNKHVNGRVTVIALSTLAVVATLPAGAVPRTLIADHEGEQVFVLSDHAPYAKTREERYGELRVIRGADVAATIPVAAAPRFVRITPDRQSILVVSGESIVTIDLAALAPTGRITVPQAGITWWTIPDWTSYSRRVHDLVVDPAGRRAYAVHEDSSQLSVLDLHTRTRIGTVTTGRKGPKIAAFVSALMLSVSSYSAGQQYARSTGSSTFTYNVYSVLPAHTELAMRPDGRFVYVLNWQTRDLTIVDANTLGVIGHLPDLGYWLALLPQAGLLSVVGPEGVRFIDMALNREIKQLALSAAARWAALSPDTRRLFVSVSGKVLCLDARTGRFLASFQEFDDPMDIVFARPADGRRPALQ